MDIFVARRYDETQQHRDTYSRYEIVYSIVDFIAAFTFIIGSIFFFYESLLFAGTWMFLIGSICFALRPTIRLVRELHLARLSRRLAGQILPEEHPSQTVTTGTKED